jgi:hypothetical protein
MSKPGQLGLIRHNAIADELIEADRESHQPGDSGHARGGNFIA